VTKSVVDSICPFFAVEAQLVQYIRVEAGATVHLTNNTSSPNNKRLQDQRPASPVPVAAVADKPTETDQAPPGQYLKYIIYSTAWY
jgi:hypothetical protein